MKLKRIDKDWWIVDAEPYEVDGEVFDSYGPYRTRAEAYEDMRSMRMFFSNLPRGRRDDSRS